MPKLDFLNVLPLDDQFKPKLDFFNLSPLDDQFIPKLDLFNISPLDDQFIPKLDLFNVSTVYRRPVYTQTGFVMFSQQLHNSTQQTMQTNNA